MPAILGFIFTLAQLIIIIGSYLMKENVIYLTAVYYGSPIYLMSNFFTADSMIKDSNPLYLGLFVYHIFKYFLIFWARAVGERDNLRFATIFFEAVYLVICAYYTLS